MNLTFFITASIALTIQKYADKYREEDLSKTLADLESDRSLPRIKTYDFIIVGGGEAGCLLAGRLSEHFSVLLLESGGSPVPATYNPYLDLQVAAHPAINFMYPSVRQENFAGENGGFITVPTGRMLGGSGSHNAFVYNRGSPLDYDHFANLTGDESWSYREMLQHFKSFESFHGKLIHEEERAQYYGTTGPLFTETDWPPLVDGWLRSGEELGFQIGDSNGFLEDGFSPEVKLVKNGERVSSFTAFVKPFESTRTLLKVLRYSDVQTVLIDAHKRAYGVTYFRHGIPQIAHASKEVIISAGTFSSPLLLIRSGIGPREVLTKAGIPVTQDLAGVGQNFRNHPTIRLSFNIGRPDWTLFSLLGESQVEKELTLYQNGDERKGFFTEMDFSPQAFLVSKVAKSRGEITWPDIRIMLNQHPAMVGNEWTVTMGVVLTRPMSVGRIGFNVTEYLSSGGDSAAGDVKMAVVDHRQLSREEDIEAIMEGLRLGLKVMEDTSTFKAMNVRWRSEDSPVACAGLPLRSDAYWRCYIKQRGGLTHHFSGTCKMGRNSDPLAVVDSNLRVRGIQNLRVADASILPQPNDATIVAQVMVTAEKLARDLLRVHHRR